MGRLNSRGLGRVFGVMNALVFALCINAIYLVWVNARPMWAGEGSQGPEFQWMFLAHLVLGVLWIPLFAIYVVAHARRGMASDNRRARRAGVLLATAGTLVIVSGLLLTRGIPWLEVRSPDAREFYYWLHVITPLAGVGLALWHRRAGAGIHWPGAVGVLAAALLATAGYLYILPDEGAAGLAGALMPDNMPDFSPSLAATGHGGYIDAAALMMDDYCAECHADIHASWSDSAHRFSSLNNPVYAFAFANTREFLTARDGSDEAINFCAACHDPVLMFSGKLQEAQVEDPESRAGIGCVACHAITAVRSPRGNADYVLSAPQHYPFVNAANPLLKWVNHQLIKANPSFHKETFLKPLHRQPEFCGSCHKVHIPEELNGYKWLRGQNHYDSFLLSSMSGAGVNSFYYPQRPVTYCGDCHMKPFASADLAASRDPEDGAFKVHDHLMPGGHSALGVQMALGDSRQQQVERMLQGALRVDLFGLRAGGRPDGVFMGPLGQQAVSVTPGQSYVLEVVLRNITPGHTFTQGTADSNEIWLEMTVRDGDRLIAHSGEIAPGSGAVDRDAHFVNSYVVDREGNRINLRNAEDIFTTVYNNQIGPGAADTVHYALDIPADVTGPLTLEAKLHYRKFSSEMVAAVAGFKERRNDLPIVTIAADLATLPVGASPSQLPPARPGPAVPEWERWNDYGIGLLAKSGLGQLPQAEEAFSRVEASGSAAGALNLARVYLRGGRLENAATALARVETDGRVAPPWTRAWLESELAMSNGRIDAAIALLRQIIASDFPGAAQRGFNFERDYRVWVRLGQAFLLRARLERGGGARSEARDSYLRNSEEAFTLALALDPENPAAHYGLVQVYAGLGADDLKAKHRLLHDRYRPDDSARGQAVAAARARDSAARRASNDLVIYPLLVCPGGKC